MAIVKPIRPLPGESTNQNETNETRGRTRRRDEGEEPEKRVKEEQGTKSPKERYDSKCKITTRCDTNDRETEKEKEAGDARQKATEKERGTGHKITPGRKRNDTNTRRQTEKKARRPEGSQSRPDGAHAPVVIVRPSNRGGEETDETKDKRRTRLQEDAGYV